MVLDRVCPIKYISDCSCQLFSLYFPALVCDKHNEPHDLSNQKTPQYPAEIAE